MKIYLLFFLLTASLFSCEEEEIERKAIPAKIVLQGNVVDTAYLYTTYTDPGAKYFEDNTIGYINDGDFINVTDISGTVNTNLPGTCYLRYNAKNADGKALATVTRTIHVVENSTAFLNGNYNVACTCTSVAGPINNIVSNTYTASIAANPAKDHFDLIGLHIGAERVSADATLNNHSITLFPFSPDYDHTCSMVSGTLSATKNTFTIDSKFYRYTPRVTYTCRNVYTKQLVIN